MSSKKLPSRSVSASGPASASRGLVIHPPDPLALIREGGIMISEGTVAFSGFPFTAGY
jgi:hypothetical protein